MVRYLIVITYSATCNGTLQTQTALDYYPYGKELRAYNSAAEKYKSTTNERDLETGYDYRYMRLYNHDVVRFNSIDPIAAAFPAWSGYHYVVGNPISHIDPFGMDTIRHATLRTVQVTAPRLIPRFRDRIVISEASMIDILDPLEHHFGGNLEGLELAAYAYSKIPQSELRGPYHQTTKALNQTFGTNLKSGKWYQGVKGFVKSSKGVLGKAGVVGMFLTGANAINEIKTDKWDAHTFVDVGFLVVGAGLAFGAITLSPAAVVGLGVYGVAHWAFNFDDDIDAVIGRNSPLVNAFYRQDPISTPPPSGYSVTVTDVH